MIILKDYEGRIQEKEKAGEEQVKAIEEILKQTEEDADKVNKHFTSILKLEYITCTFLLYMTSI